MLDDSRYPLVTFALFAYNQEQYIREAVEAALAQDYPNLEIIISDDCSTDGTWNCIVETVQKYRGKHKVFLSRNNKNLGFCAHVNAVAERASGGLVVMGAGDDISYPRRTSEIVDAWLAAGMPDAVLHSLSRIMIGREPTNQIAAPYDYGETGVSLEKYLDSGLKHAIRGQSAAYSKSLFTCFGLLQAEGAIEDQPLVFRALLTGARVIQVDRVLLDYRVTGANACMGYSRSQRSRTRRWMQARHFSVLQQVRDYRLSGVDFPGAEEAMAKELTRLEKCVGMASSNPIRLVVGLMAYTEGQAVRDRVATVFRFYDLLDSRMYRIVSRISRLGGHLVRPLGKILGKSSKHA